MSIEKRGSLLEPSSSERPPLPDFGLEDMKNVAAGDERLGELYEEIVEKIDVYIDACQSHVRWSENKSAQILKPEKYNDTLHKKDVDRHQAHHHLIVALGAFAARCKRRGIDASWWDGPEGLNNDTDNNSTRERVFDWATDVWLQKEESESASD